MLGLVIGLVFDGQTAQVAQMITLIVLAFLGGIFIPYSNLPDGIQMIGKALPSYHLVQLGWDAAGGFALHAATPCCARRLGGGAGRDRDAALAAGSTATA